MPNYDILPCPFCGSDPDIIDDRTIWVIQCCHCSATISGDRAPEPTGEETEEYWLGYQQTAIERWNRRTNDI